MEEIKGFFEAEELEIFGISGAEPLPEEESQFKNWIALGFQGTMGYLERHAGKKYRPQELLPECKSLIFTGLNYFVPRGNLPAGHAAVAGFARGRDYHNVLGKRLRRIAGNLRESFQDERFYTFVDTSPLAERPFAARAGVGFIGRNTLLIRRGLGSWFVIGGIATTLALDTVRPAPAGNDRGHAGSCPPGCRRCIDACPTGALFAPHRIDASKCISYLTIEHRGVIDPNLALSAGGWIFGCDACQEVCPFNKPVESTYVADLLAPRAGESLSVEDVLSIETDAEFTERFAGSPVMRAKRSGLVRNACICAVNLGLITLLPVLEKLTSDADRVIAKQAAWAVKALGGG